MKEEEAKKLTLEVWVALDDNGGYEVATDPDTAFENLKNSADDLTICRVVKLNVTMTEPRYGDDDDETDKAVDVPIPDDAGRIVEI